ncbi:hypothetical protein E9531_16905 [Lampropedia puyangensis]|uniref:Uncharacterized protein n=1 Tax=Lampropedia puyangensis TaxID=1330072 RepID=A0A4S8ER37_9BURK|nr:Ig-like domain-containing protein [Lampropedia puyangensis]THT95974.1 hypothetical protein E9531_16905 [Lampropedia puyangensis]
MKHSHTLMAYTAVKTGLHRLLALWCFFVLVWMTALQPAHAAGDAQLLIQDGVVVKFGPGSGLYVRDKLQTGAGVVLSSAHDDSLHGPSTHASSAQPAAGDWLGLMLDASVTPANVQLNGLGIRYAGGTQGLPSHLQGGAGLTISGQAYTFSRLDLRENSVGLRVVGAGSPLILESSIRNNAVGVLAEQGAVPTLSVSSIADNSDYGVRNTNPTTIVDAQGNWWGHASGPRDVTGNPTGQGNRVSSGVNYGQFLVEEPALTCAITPTQGYITRARAIELRLDCPQAAQYRLSENQSTLESQPWLDMAGHPTLASYTLSTGAGDKTVFVQFKTAQGSTSVFGLSQAIAYIPEGPLTQWLQPAANAVLEQNTTLVVSVTDPEGIREVEFLQGTKRIGVVSQAPYEVLWNLTGVANGTHQLTAKATNFLGLSSSVNRTVTVQRTGGAGPTLVASLNGEELQPNVTLTQPGQLQVTAESEVGIASITAQVNGVDVFSRTYANISPASASQFVDFAQLPNGTHQLIINATDANGVATALTIPFTLALQAPAAPVIHSPSTGALVGVANLAVSGVATAGSQVQLYLNGNSIGSPVTASTNGGFGLMITLPAAGQHQLHATATNSRGTSAQSASVVVTYEASAPTVAFASPSDNAQLTAAADTRVSVSVTASAASGIAQVQLFANSQVLATLNDAPYTTQWSLANLPAGTYTLRAVATGQNGVTATATRQVNVSAPTIPVAPPTPYTGKVQSVTPQHSFGQDPIVIQGQALNRESGQPQANAVLRLLFKVGGFERRINLASDATGQFRYEFIPQNSDSGMYEVAAMHPDETDFTAQSSFSINRLSFSPDGYSLNAAREFPSTITIQARASGGTGAPGVRWVAEPANQPSGSLPPGISLDLGSPIDVPAGQTVPMLVRFTGSSSAGETGTVVLTAYASDTSNSPRGTFTISYRLSNATPSLFAKPTYVETGVQQGNSVTEQVTIGNRGLVAAQNVRIRLVDHQGNAAPSWIFLSSSSNIGAVNVGAEVPIQVTASPGVNVADGIYNFRILVDADNQGQGSIPVSVAVTQSGEGGVIFSVSDIFTDTLDSNGQAIQGVNNARIRLQNEAVQTQVFTLTTDATGRASIDNIPPGTYVYRASGPRHSDKSGRIFVRPGISIREHVHLSYQTVSVDFSVTETTIQDEYNIVLEATYQTQVPAPVVLLEPMAINLPDLQIGEEFTGELTLTNYGLVQAENVKFNPPTSDEYYTYEFFAEIPKVLPAKTRIYIPYRVTAKKLHPKGMGFMRTPTDDWNSELQKNVASLFSAKASSCSSYAQQATGGCDWVCANGEVESSSFGTTFSRLVGASCGAGTTSQTWPYKPPPPRPGSPWGVGGYPGGSGGIPLAPGCTPHCPACDCGMGGAGGGGGGGGGGSFGGSGGGGSAGGSPPRFSSR